MEREDGFEEIALTAVLVDATPVRRGVNDCVVQDLVSTLAPPAMTTASYRYI